MATLTIIQKTAFGPATWNIPRNSDGSPVDITGGVIVRINNGTSRDSTIQNGEIVTQSNADNSIDIIWNLPEATTEALALGRYAGEVIMIDAQGEDRIGDGDGTFSVIVRDRLPQP